MSLQSGDVVPDFEAVDLTGNTVSAQAMRGRKWMMSFLRFASCPFCNLRVHELAAKQAAFEGKLNVVAVFQSPPEHLQKFAQRLPFSIIADPEMRLFRLFEGELSTGKFITGHAFHVPRWVEGVRQGGLREGLPLGELRLVPADFLIDASGVIRRAYYGRDVSDHLPLREITAFTTFDGTTTTAPHLL